LDDDALWPALAAVGFDRAPIVRDVEAAVVDAVLAGGPRGRSSAALFEFSFELDVNSRVFLSAVAAADSGECEVVIRDFLNIALVPQRTPFAERIEEVFAKTEFRPLARFVDALELEFAEARRGGFRRIFPTKEKSRDGEADEALARYVALGEAEQAPFYAELVPVFDQYVEDLLDCKNQNPTCGVA
jgi:hypothetical protein